jgi:hypothetical protein
MHNFNNVLETISCGVLWKSTYFVGVTTFFYIEPSTFNFHVYVMGWQCGAKFKGCQGISLDKFEISRVAKESPFKLGMGEEGIATTWCKLVANKFLTHLKLEL